MVRKGGLLYSERPAGLLRKGGFFTPKYAIRIQNEMNLKLILRGFSFRFNFYILIAMMIFTIAYNFVPQFPFGYVCIAIVILCAIVSTGPALIRTMQTFIIKVSAIPKRICEVLRNLFTHKYDLDPKYNEILNEIQYLCSLMEINQKVKLKLVPNLINAGAAGNIITFGKPLLEKLDQEEIKAIIAHELSHIKRNHLEKFVFYILCLITVLLILGALLHHFTPIKLTNFTDVFLLIGIVAVSFRVISWSQEYEADIIAAQYVNKDAMKSVWLTVAKTKKMDINWSYYSHPSISNRMANLDWPPNVRHNKWYLSLD